MQNAGLIEKIQSLPPETISEVEDFVDFLTEKQSRVNSKGGSVNLRERNISEQEAAEQRAVLSSFAEDWDSPEMDVYDKL